MKRALLLTYSFPPSSHSNATRPYLLAKKLLAEGWKVDVFCSSFGLTSDFDEVSEHLNLTVKRIKDPLGFIYTCPDKVSQKLQLLASLLLWPDSRIMWVFKALSVAKRCVAHDIVIGSVVPRSMLLGPAFYQNLSSCWMLDYQEPISAEQLEWVRRIPVQRICWPLLGRLEKKALKQCAKAVFSCENCRDAYVEEGLVAAADTEVVYHCYDEQLFDSMKKPSNESTFFEMVYAGNFAGKRRGDRNPSGFLKALRKFLDAHPEAVAETRFVFYGTWRKEHDGLLDELNLRVNTVLNHRVSYKEYIKIIQSSSVLLLVVSPQHKLHLPGKLVEYFGAKRPVLAFVDTEGEAYRILKETGYEQFTCGMSDSEAGAKAIERLWREWKSGRLSQLSENTEKWSASIQMNRYMELIDKVISKE